MKALAITVALLLAACSSETQAPTVAVDQCMRKRYFDECMGAISALPASRELEGMAEVVLECDLTSQAQSRRRIDNIRKECRQ